MFSNVISLPVATSSENSQALAEVSHFGLTDMGYKGQGPWTYRILHDPALTRELAQMSGARSYGCVDIITLQPCPPHIYLSQDRYVIEEWDLPGGAWKFNGVFDGHLNHQAVDYVVRTLPLIIKQSLHSALAAQGTIPSARISEILQASVIDIDNSIASQFLDLFPRDVDSLSRLKDSDIRPIFDKNTGGNRNYDIMARSLGGTTLILSLTDSKRNMWVANLGDCRAVLGYRNQDRWCGIQLNWIHDANNMDEVHRIRDEHPDEADPIRNNRVIGFLEPTRAIGDVWLKLPGIYASRIYPNLRQKWIVPEKFKEYSKRILTPPYVSNIPDVYHHVLPDSPCLILLASDGLVSASTQYSDIDIRETVGHWIQIVAQGLDLDRSSNAALTLLRHVLGGDDTQVVSRNLTVEMEERWMDDTTILIQRVGFD